MQGTTEPHHARRRAARISVRNEQLLEFNKVRYQIVAGSEVVAEGDAGICAGRSPRRTWKSASNRAGDAGEARP